MNLRDAMFQARSPGTWGEFIQGESNGRRLLVSLPSEHCATAKVRMRRRKFGESPVITSPNKKKSRQAVEHLLQVFGERDVLVEMSIRSTLTVGVGHASSSADVLCALRAVTIGLGKRVSDSWLCQIASSIEPTNPCIIPETCLFDPDHGTIMGRASFVPKFRIQMLSCGQSVDTIKARDSKMEWSLTHRQEFQKILELFKCGVEQSSITLIAQASTRSALLNAERNERQDILDAYKTAKLSGALGIATSHSGSSVVALHQANFRGVEYV